MTPFTRLRLLPRALSATLMLAGMCSVGFVTPAVRGAVVEDKLKFEMYQDTSKEYRWRLKSADGGILATGGQGYSAKATCQHAIESIKKGADGDKLKFETYEDSKKEFRWRLKSSNGQTIASSSKAYSDKADCEKVIETVKENVKDAEVTEASS